MTDPPQNSDHSRRPRYHGTHPRRFEERYKEHDAERFPGMQQHVRAQGRTPAGTHVPVMVDEVLAALDPRSGDVAADCTLGYGGHAMRIMERIGPGGTLVGLDFDGEELERTQRRCELFAAQWNASRRPDGSYASVPGADDTAVAPDRTGSDATQTPAAPDEVDAAPAPIDEARDQPGAPLQPAVRIVCHRSHYAGLGNVMRDAGVAGFDAILADLGVSSMQIDDPARGFGYKFDGPLDMRMDRRHARGAADVLRDLSEGELSAALFELADEPDHEAIARHVVRARARSPILRTSQLVRVVLEAKGVTERELRARRAEQPGALHPAARTFQALRILVNDELSGLRQFLRVAPYCLRPGGRLAIISFHSGEDDLVRDAFSAGLDGGLFESICGDALRPSAKERFDNPRSASARLRWARASQAAQSQ